MSIKTPIRHSDLANDKIQPKGKYLVVELIVDHHQDLCIPIQKGTRGIITGFQRHSKKCIFAFSNEGLPEEEKTWSTHNIRVIDQSEYIPLGRINHV